MGRRRTCKECRKIWRRRVRKWIRKEMKRQGKKMKEFYPDWVYHTGDTQLCAKHRAAKLAYGAQRRAKKLDATPAWADHEAIKAIYAEAVRLTEETGVKHHVDHIVPLNHPLVCGLHVETNLQILTARENVKKSNKFECG